MSPLPSPTPGETPPDGASCGACCPPLADIPTRISRERLLEQVSTLLEAPVVQVVLETVGGFVLILNEARQILAMNQDVLGALGIHDSDPLLGLRPGDALRCINALEAVDGCHTSGQCASCGAFLTLHRACLGGTSSTGTCSLLRLTGGHLEPAEFSVKATPLEVGGQRILVVVLQDISAQCAKASLERLFYHDLQNTVQALQGWCEMLRVPNAKPERVSHHLLNLTTRLTQELNLQRVMHRAEHGTLEAKPVRVNVEAFFEDLRSYFEGHPVSHGRLLRLAEPAIPTLHTDPVLLMRILVNATKNALEAAEPGDCVDVTLDAREGRPVFQVSNPGQLPPEVEQGLFHRTFSTKGTPGRGYGTYGMKLLGETYLGGRVGIHQDRERSRVIFYIELPRTTLALTK